MQRLLVFLLLPLLLFAQGYRNNSSPPRVPPEEVERQLSDAEKQFEHARTLFTAWYTGPLITPSATMVPPGMYMWQPYIYFTDNYGAFNSEREWVDAPNRFFINPVPLILQIGVTDQVDTLIIAGAIAQWQEGKFSGGIQDTTLQLGFLVQKETPWVPKAKFSIGQSFPTGKYKNLDPDNIGLDGTGVGAWGTTFTLTFGKVLFWNTAHPVNSRLSFQYKLSTPIRVSNFNSWGGGYGTQGVVKPGNTFTADMGLELSVNQPWVVAIDIVYTATNRTKFNGNPGTTTEGGTTPASIGGGYSDQLSLCPAVEYNFNINNGIITGIWFSVYGKNAVNFVSGVFSWCWVF